MLILQYMRHTAGGATAIMLVSNDTLITNLHKLRTLLNPLLIMCIGALTLVQDHARVKFDLQELVTWISLVPRLHLHFNTCSFFPASENKQRGDWGQG